MKKYILFTLFVSMLFAFSVKASTQLPINMSNHETVTAAVTPGLTEVELPITVDLADNLMIELVLPIDNAQIKVFDPAGNEIISSNHPGIKIELGKDQQPALPGFYALLPTIANPQAGEWKVKVSFSAVDYKTVIIAQTLIQTPVTYGLAIPVFEYILGEPVVLTGLFTDRGQPVSNADVSFNLTLPNQQVLSINAQDDGNGLDQQVNDGLYTALHILNQVGEYQVTSTAHTQIQGVAITRQATKVLSVTDSLVDIENLSLHTVKNHKGCVTHLEQQLDVEVKKAGVYAFSAALTDGTTQRTTGVRKHLNQGSAILKLNYNKDDLISHFKNKPTLTVKPVRVIEVTPDTSNIVAANKHFDASIDLSSVEFCRDPIEITGPLVSEPNYSEDKAYIKSLTFRFPVYAENTGTYTGSVNISAANGESLKLVSFQQYFQAGDNSIEFEVDGSIFKQADGPYTLNSFLIYTRGHSLRKGVLGQTAAFKKTDFYPKANAQVIATTLGLERVNWQSLPAIESGSKRVGGYLRAGASIPYDYEVLSRFDLSEVTGQITQAKLTVNLGQSTLQYPFNQLHLHPVTQSWDNKTVTYDTFCESFFVCPAWQKQLVTFDGVTAQSQQQFSQQSLVDLVEQWRNSPETNQGVIFTSAPHAFSHFIEVLEVSLEVQYLLDE